jgi:uncharacterized protein (TIGR04255 family)
MAAKYSLAPISEVVCGVFFNNNLLLLDGTIFKLLTTLSSSFQIIQTGPTISSEEVVNGSITTSTDYISAGFSTYRLTSDDHKWQVLIQQNMITVHWVRQDQENVGHYPGFNNVYKKFKEIFSLAIDTFGDEKSFREHIKSCYLSYTDRVNFEIYKRDGQTIPDIITINPPAFSAFDKQYKADNYFSKFSGPCDQINGYYITSINSPTLHGFGQLLIVENKVKGGLSPTDPVDEWFIKAHQVQVSFFESIFTQKILKTWE